MQPVLHVRSPEVATEQGATRVTFPLHTPDGSFKLSYWIKGSPVTADTTAAVAALLLPAMRQGWAIQTEGSISARVCGALPEIESILHAWDTTHEKIPIRAGAAGSPASGGKPGRAGLFFSGGLDSYYSCLKHIERLDALIFVLGFDILLENRTLARKVLPTIRKAAQQLERPLIEVKTNLRQFSDRYASWDLAHGAALASVGLLLEAQLRTIYIPASDSYADLMANGSHPLLDPLWSTEQLEFIHDGCEANRIQKAASISQNAVALQSLRVCWKNPRSAYNCGRCEKCLRTMVSLLAVGALDRCTTFDSELDPRRVARMRLGDDVKFAAYWRENLAMIRQSGSYPALEAAIVAATRKPGPVRRLARSIRTRYLRF